MDVQAKPDPAVVNDLKTRIEDLERQADALRSGLDEIALLLSWTMDRSISPKILLRVPINDEQVAHQRQWDGQSVPVELARLFLQAHTVASRLKHLVPSADKAAAVMAVVATFHRMAEEQNLTTLVEMEATLGD